MTSTEIPVAGLTTRPATGTTLPAHGTVSRRKYHKCPCTKCRTAYNAYQRTRSRKVGYGTWQPLVDASPARQHLINLRDAGFSLAVVAKAIGRYPSCLSAIVYPVGGTVRKRIRPDLEAVILAVTPETITPGMLPAVGSTRRLRALVAAGWTTSRIAQELGVRQPRVSEIARQSIVTRAVADHVSVCYEVLRNVRPEDHGVTPTAALRSRRLAERNGWPDPLWWEDMGHIDDPSFDPATAERPLNKQEQGALRAREILHLASYGASPEEIATRLGLGRDYVTTRLRELREVAA